MNMPDSLEMQYKQLQNLYHRRGKERQTVQAYQEFLAEHPKHIDAWMDLGALLHQEGDISAALQCYQKVIKIDSTQLDAWSRKAMVLEELNRSQDPAFSQLQHLSNVYKQHYKSVKDLRKDLLTCYDKILQSDGEPNSSVSRTALKSKARVLEQVGKHKEALAIYKELLPDEEFDRQRHHIQLSISRQYEALKKYDQAIDELDPLIKAGDHYLLLHKARILKLNKKNEEAEKNYRMFLEKIDAKYEETKDVAYIFQKASGYEQMGDIEGAINCLDDLLNSGIKMSLRLTDNAKDGIARLKKLL
jgi:tetratricopeptide (TPR) repeat protein